MKMIPLFRVDDMKAAIAFYTQILDFRLLYPSDSEEDPVVNLQRGAAELMLSRLPGDQKRATCAHLLVEDVDALFSLWTRRGLDQSQRADSPVHQGPLDQSWGAREFYVADPSGNTLRILQRPSPSAAALARARSDAHAEPALLSAEPQLFVRNIAAACDFYAGKLGFAPAFQWGAPPFYAQIFRGGARLNLRQLDRPAIDAELRDRDQLLSASIVVDGVDGLYAECKAAGVLFAQALVTQPWGARTFVIRDLDENLVLFAGR